MKVKVFGGQNKEVEREINSFLSVPIGTKERIEVKFVTQSECLSTKEWIRSILVWYEETDKEEQDSG